MICRSTRPSLLPRLHSRLRPHTDGGRLSARPCAATFNSSHHHHQEMASRNGRGGGATPGGRAARQPTPTSPSPSPEPSSESTRIDANNLLGGHNALNANNNPASSSSSGGLLPSALGPGNNSGRSTHSGVPGQTPFHHVLPLEEDPNEPYRQRAEDCTRNVIDSLYQLAVCAADVQVGREDIIGMKV